MAKPQQLSSRGGAVNYKLEGRNLMIAIAYEEAPVPDHYYVADFFEIVPQDLEVLIIFGKLDHPKGDRLRSKVEIVFPAHMFVRQIWHSSRQFQKTVAEFVEKNQAKALKAGGVSLEVEKVQTVHANNCLMVLSAGQALMDFFYISAKELWLRPQRNEPINIEALVRIIASASLVLGFLQEIDRVAQGYIKKLGKEELQLEDEEEDENLESE